MSSRQTAFTVDESRLNIGSFFWFRLEGYSVHLVGGNHDCCPLLSWAFRCQWTAGSKLWAAAPSMPTVCIPEDAEWRWGNLWPRGVPEHQRPSSGAGLPARPAAAPIPTCPLCSFLSLPHLVSKSLVSMLPWLPFTCALSHQAPS